MTIHLTKHECKLLLSALYAANQWEDSYADAHCGSVTGRPIEPIYSRANKLSLRYLSLREKVLKQYREIK